MNTITDIIADDWDGDYAELLRLMRWKLRRMRDKMLESRLLIKETLASQMDRCIFLIDRIEEENYRDDEYTQHEETWGELECPVCGEFICQCFPVDSGHEIVALYENAHTDELDTQANEEYLAIARRAKEDLACDVRELFEILSDHILEWWC